MGVIQNSINQLLTLSGAAAYLHKESPEGQLTRQLANIKSREDIIVKQQDSMMAGLKEKQQAGTLSTEEKQDLSDTVAQATDLAKQRFNIQPTTANYQDFLDRRLIQRQISDKIKDKVDQGEQFKKVKELVQQNANLFNMEVKNNG